MDAALNHLNWLIDQGVEYPDAHYRAVDFFGCDATALQAEYDQQFTHAPTGANHQGATP